MSKRYIKRSFVLDATNFEIEGYEDTNRYNNGPLPYVTRPKLNYLIAYMNEHRVIMSFHGDLLVWCDPDYYPDNEAVIIKPITITVDKEKIQVYDLGDIGLLWQ